MAQATEDKKQGETSTAEASEFSSLLKKNFKPQSDRAREEVETAVATRAEQALSTTALVSSDAVASIQSIIAELDRKLTDQINEVLHHPDFQALEGSWRGLHYMVNNTETDTMLKIKVMNISKKDLHKTLKKFKGAAWDQSPLFKKLYEEEYGQLGGEPYGCLVGDYYVDHSPVDVELVGEMSKIASAIHEPFITAAAPSRIQIET